MKLYTMDKFWLVADRRSKEYMVEVEIFLKFASKHSKNSEYMHYPCRKCENMNFEKIKEVKDHIYFNGVHQSYTDFS